MAKKRFSAGLDDLFNSNAPETLDVVRGGDMSEITVRPGSDKKTTVKSFATDLDALLQEALEDSIEQFENGNSKKNARSDKSKSTSGASMRDGSGGLDALIRQTIDIKELERDEATGVRRLTVAVDRTKLEKLKTIARLENSYLKDLLIGLIDEYIVGYTHEKGIPL